MTRCARPALAALGLWGPAGEWASVRPGGGGAGQACRASGVRLCPRAVGGTREPAGAKYCHTPGVFQRSPWQRLAAFYGVLHVHRPHLCVRC